MIAGYYPWSDNPARGVFNERSARALDDLCDGVEVLAPRPYAPPVISSWVPRWRSYRRMPGHEIRNGILVRRPAYPVVPRVGGALWDDPGGFIWCRRTARSMHRRRRFDAILSFDLVASGGTAWRIGRDLGIPAAGWAVGGDVAAPGWFHRRAVLRAVTHLDLVFYQSRELLEAVAHRLGRPPGDMPSDRHVVLPRGIPLPPVLGRTEVRERTRAEWSVQSDQLVVLTIGRIVRDKGVFELLDAVSLASRSDPRLVCVLVGANPAFDETGAVVDRLSTSPALRGRVKLLPACSPERIWEYLCAADIFAFPSHREGMPNSLLEAMAMGVPVVAFPIPPVLEVKGATQGIAVAPVRDAAALATTLLGLAASPDERASIGADGRARVMQGFMLGENMAEALRRLASVVRRPR